MLREGSGTPFDPDAVEVFLEIEASIKRIAAELADGE